MGSTTKIEWAGATWNPVVGCSHVSAGCNNCYAERMAARFEHGRYHGVVTSGKWNGKTEKQSSLFNPLTAKKPRTIFVCSMGDLFHESVQTEWIDKVMAVIALTPQHRYMILTKRPSRLLQYKTDTKAYDRVLIAAEKIRNILPELNRIGISDPVLGFLWRNLALGVSVENQETADERVPLLLETPAFRRFVSYEPAIGKIDLQQPSSHSCETEGCVRNGICPPWMIQLLDLVIMGGESGPKARPMHPDWARSMRDQCAESGVPFMFKQWGQFRWVNDPSCPGRVYAERCGKKAAGRLLDGIEHNGSIDWGGGDA